MSERAYSINDSGNAATVFTVDASARIVDTHTLAEGNYDWESITASPQHLYIGDIGNNKGTRKRLTIEKLNRESFDHEATLHIRYARNTPSHNVPYAHDYDAEAMVWHDNRLRIFSKSWATRKAHVYEVNTDLLQQELTAVATIEGLPGVITGADWDDGRQHYVVVGYASDPFGNFDTFLAEVSAQFNVLNVWSLPDYDQVEGVCAAADGSYWVTQEATENQPALLFTVHSPTPITKK
ncbi:hypothetical protein OCL06_01995 [Alteromonas sp. ASW11-19]|uniref:WD40 repeat domain-containing protein n=1 Tax=Alteromonas salexigens TaxID=2982530 RepID=A0ABT2VK35_9ALTE|nr:hypothetical protein [Alteromonas salexigens]MCU7553365.1 hypothetical protein [Alteromonas salexigens]